MTATIKLTMTLEQAAELLAVIHQMPYYFGSKERRERAVKLEKKLRAAIAKAKP